MKKIDTAIPDILCFEPQTFEDARGHFFESFNQALFEELVGHRVVFVQDNQSLSCRDVVRGLHYQLPPKAQGKLVRALRGEIFDVAVDLRRSSPYFGKWVGQLLSSKNRRQLWIPAGFAHGFRAISDSAEVLYKTTNYYSVEHERSICWSDKDLSISWSDDVSFTASLSDKDAKAKSFRNADMFP